MPVRFPPRGRRVAFAPPLISPSRLSRRRGRASPRRDSTRRAPPGRRRTPTRSPPTPRGNLRTSRWTPSPRRSTPRRPRRGFRQSRGAPPRREVLGSAAPARGRRRRRRNGPGSPRVRRNSVDSVASIPGTRRSPRTSRETTRARVEVRDRTRRRRTTARRTRAEWRSSRAGDPRTRRAPSTPETRFGERRDATPTRDVPPEDLFRNRDGTVHQNRASRLSWGVRRGDVARSSRARTRFGSRRRRRRRPRRPRRRREARRPSPPRPPRTHRVRRNTFEPPPGARQPRGPSRDRRRSR